MFYKFLLFIFIFAITIENLKSELKQFDYSSNNFKIKFPINPNIYIDSSETIEFEKNKEFPIFTKNWECDLDDTLHPNSYYIISQTDYPNSYIHSDSTITLVNEFINSTQSGLYENSKYKLLSSGSIEKNGYPGKFFKWRSTESDIFFEFQIYLINNKLFQLSIVTDQHHNTYIKSFFESFELVGITNGNFKLPSLNQNRTFTINFPSKPKEETKVLDSDDSQVIIDIQILDNKINDIDAFVAMETKMQESFEMPNNNFELNKLYFKSINNSVNSVNGTLVSLNDISYKNINGKEFKVYIGEGEKLMIYRIFFYKNNLYNFGVVTDTQNENNKYVLDFFNSFNLIESK